MTFGTWTPALSVPKKPGAQKSDAYFLKTLKIT